MLRGISRVFRLSLSRKVYGLLLLMLGSVGSAVFVAIQFQAYSANMQQLIVEDGQFVMRFVEIENSINQEVSELGSFMLTGDPGFVNGVEKNALKIERTLSVLLSGKYKPHHKQIGRKLSALQAKHLHLKSLIKQAIELQADGRLSNKARAKVVLRVDSRHMALQETLRRLVLEEQAESKSVIAAVNATVKKGVLYFSFLGVLAIVVIIVAAMVLRYNVAKPIASLLKAFRLVAGGNLTHRVNVRTGDDMEDLANEFNYMITSLSASENERTQRMDELSNLYDVSRTISSSTEINEISKIVLNSSLKALKAAAGSIMLLDPETRELKARAVAGLDNTSIAKHWSCVNEVPGNYTISQYQEHCAVVPNCLQTPLASEGEVIGFINVSGKRNAQKFSEQDAAFLSTLSGQLVLAIKNIRLFEQTMSASVMTIRALAAALDAKDHYTHGHSKRVAGYSVALADRAGLDSQTVQGIETAAFLHDIGKIGVPEGLLNKPGSLSLEEMAVVCGHPLIGAGIIEHISFSWPGVFEAVKHHHERFDGKGYPDALQGEEISVGARILAIADAWDAMISDRPYRTSFSEAEAMDRLAAGKGRQFDAVLVDLFFEILKEGQTVMPTVRPVKESA